MTHISYNDYSNGGNYTSLGEVVTDLRVATSTSTANSRDTVKLTNLNTAMAGIMADYEKRIDILEGIIVDLSNRMDELEDTYVPNATTLLLIYKNCAVRTSIRQIKTKMPIYLG